MPDPAIIRVLCDASTNTESGLDANTGKGLEFWRGNSVTFELGLKKRDGSFLLAADVGTVIVQVKEDGALDTDAAIMHDTFGTGDCDSGFTAASWDAGGKLVTAPFTIAEAALDAGNYWLIVRHQDVSSNEITYCKFRLVVREDQAQTTNISPPTPPTGTPISQETADGRYLAIVTAVADYLTKADAATTYADIQVETDLSTHQIAINPHAITPQGIGGDIQTQVAALPEHADSESALAAGVPFRRPYIKSTDGSLNAVTLGHLQSDAELWLPGDEASGDLLDETANARDFTESSAPGTRTTGGFTGRDLDGTDDYFDLSSNEPAFHSGDWHLCAHIYLDTVPTGGAKSPIFTRGQTTGDKRSVFFVVEDGGILRIHVSSDGTATNQITVDSPAATIAAATWYWVEAFYDATNDELGVAVNGGLWWYDAWTLGIHNPTGPTTNVGRVEFNTVRYWDGVLRFVGMFNRRLLPQERQALYNEGTPLGWSFATPSS